MIKSNTSSRIKRKNFLSNISYNNMKEDFYNRNFVFDTFFLLTKNLNPSSLERKVSDLKSRKIINMFWEECVEKSFYCHICERDNFLYLNGKNVLYPQPAEIVWNYVKKRPGKYCQVEKMLEKEKKFSCNLSIRIL